MRLCVGMGKGECVGDVRVIGASLSEPHTDKFRFCRVYIYICAVRTAYRIFLFAATPTAA